LRGRKRKLTLVGEKKKRLVMTFMEEVLVFF